MSKLLTRNQRRVKLRNIKPLWIILCLDDYGYDPQYPARFRSKSMADNVIINRLIPKYGGRYVAIIPTYPITYSPIPIKDSWWFGSKTLFLMRKIQNI